MPLTHSRARPAQSHACIHVTKEDGSVCACLSVTGGSREAQSVCMNGNSCSICVGTNGTKSADDVRVSLDEMLPVNPFLRLHPVCEARKHHVCVVKLV